MTSDLEQLWLNGFLILGSRTQLGKYGKQSAQDTNLSFFNGTLLPWYFQGAAG